LGDSFFSFLVSISLFLFGVPFAGLWRVLAFLPLFLLDESTYFVYSPYLTLVKISYVAKK
jgi:hypothetical protein